MNISQLDPDNGKWKYYVSEKRYIKMKKYLQRKDRALSLGVELLLNLGLQELYPNIKCPVSCLEDENGKLYLPDYPHIYFNLSHSEEYAVCAISDVALGVDIEYCSDIDLNTVNSYFLGLEYAYIMEKPELERINAFYELWTLKESYMKAAGFGFRLAFDAFCIHMREDITVVQDRKIQPYSFYHTQFDKYKLAVCYQGCKTGSITTVLCKLSDSQAGIKSVHITSAEKRQAESIDCYSITNYPTGL
ncbi:MAG: 4'-phosphopantetheinyl transferase superfamily protein [Syntrophomonas sp.]